MVVMGTGYRVDVAALQETVTKLRTLSADLSSTQGSAKYNTTLAAGALGINFQGATGLLSAHDNMQAWIAEMIGSLQQLIDDYSGQTHQVASNYGQQEAVTKQDLYSNG